MTPARSRPDTIALAAIGGVLAIGLMLAALLSGCVPAWATAGALADTATLSTTRYQAWTHGQRRKVTAAHAAECGTDASCYARHVAAWDASQEPVRACFKVAGPLVEAAAKAAEGRDSAAAAAVLPRLAAQVPICVEAIERAKRSGP